jgi:DNA-binding response OmpR family regulator
LLRFLAAKSTDDGGLYEVLVMAAILLVDDCTPASETLALLLRKRGYTVTYACNGREGPAAIRTAMPALVLLDVEMPEMDGLTLLELVRQSIGPSALPVILLTGVNDESLVTRAIELGVTRVFRKGSLDLGELLACIATCIDREEHAASV